MYYMIYILIEIVMTWIISITIGKKKLNIGVNMLILELVKIIILLVNITTYVVEERY